MPLCGSARRRIARPRLRPFDRGAHVHIPIDEAVSARHFHGDGNQASQPRLDPVDGQQLRLSEDQLLQPGFIVSPTRNDRSVAKPGQDRLPSAGMASLPPASTSCPVPRLTKLLPPLASHLCSRTTSSLSSISDTTHAWLTRTVNHNVTDRLYIDRRRWSH